MKRKNKTIAGFLAGISAMMMVMSPITTMADSVDLNKPYLSLGADLTSEQKATVLSTLDIKESDLENYTVATITNADEHKYLDSYLSSSVIGTKALSCAKVVGKEDGYGVKVTTYHITYCTTGMYQNALVTAGISNADVVVAGPFDISGTAALVGAIESYSNMTGQEVSQESIDAATNELVATAEIAENIDDSTKAEELVGVVKDMVVSEDLSSDQEILDAVDKAATKLEVTLSDEDRQQILDLMHKIDGLDLDIDSIKEQAQDLYNKLDGMDLSSLGVTQSDLDEAEGFFGQLWNDIKDFFSNLFG